MNLKPVHYVLVTLAALLLAAAGYFVWWPGKTIAPSSTFVLLDGSTQRTEAFKGKVTLVNFWATSCTSCVAEMPEMVKTYGKFQARGFDTVAVAMSYDRPDFVQHFARSRALPFKVAIDHNGALAQAWGEVKLTPTTYLLNRRGEIVKTFVGTPNFEQLHALIEKLLAEA